MGMLLWEEEEVSLVPAMWDFTALHDQGNPTSLINVVGPEAGYVAYSGGGWIGIRANKGVLNEDRYFELDWSSLTEQATYIGVGVFEAIAFRSYFGDNGFNGWGWMSHGYDATPAGVVSNGVSFAKGQILGLELRRLSETLVINKLDNDGLIVATRTFSTAASAGNVLYPGGAVFGGEVRINAGHAPRHAAVLPTGCLWGIY